ncbi:hypothetical protein [Methylobacterium sp. ARG-1]|uniref:hypothetical protein n=1 Tax=Methylobacterium sp. ARG-1 TaxID=1692501 RepID=UPI000680DABC|nr:hypothetical protein [Methylobacterium sp. ARG-1]KNY22655.1 hypothetical protein AKJ13_10350 [Methylobacterium sp. ARG-1]
MSERTPATDKGTADRIEADDGGYWVRLVTKQALKREGVCMGNCLDSGDYGSHTAGNEDMVSEGLWSLRKADGLSYLLVEVDTNSERTEADIEEARGPKNSAPSGWSVRQLRHLVAAFRAAGCIPQSIAVTEADGMTRRPDKAPQDLRDAVEARELQEQASAAESARIRRDAAFFIRNDPYLRMAAQSMIRNVVGDGPINPPGEVPECPDDVVLYRAGPDEPFQILRGRERLAAIQQAINRGILTGHEISLGSSTVETVTVRARGHVSQFATMNEDLTWKLHLGDIVFPKVMPTGDVGFGEVDAVTFRIAPSRNVRGHRVFRTMDGGVLAVPNLWRAEPWIEPAFEQPSVPIEAEITRVETEIAEARSANTTRSVRYLQSLYARAAGGLPGSIRMTPMSVEPFRVDAGGNEAPLDYPLGEAESTVEEIREGLRREINRPMTVLPWSDEPVSPVIRIEGGEA